MVRCQRRTQCGGILLQLNPHTIVLVFIFVIAIAIVFVIVSVIVYAANEGHNAVTFFCNLNQISFVALSVILF